jgi:integrase
MIGQNPAAAIKRPNVSRTEQRVLTPLEIGYLLKAARGDRLEALVVLALTSTMGPGELFGLRPSDVYLQERYLTVNHDLVEAAAYGYRPTLEPTKNEKRRRRIALPQIAVDALREHMKRRLAEGGGEYVFTSPDGAPIRLSNLNRRWWKPLLKKAAGLAEKDGVLDFPVDLGMYALRHTANALMGHVGVPIEVASDRMGHSSIRTTVDVYGHRYQGSDQIVAEKLDGFFDHLLEEAG